MKQLLKKYNFEKDDFLGYEYKINLKNLGVVWHVAVEKPTRKCKFYSVFTRFEFKDKNILEQINKTISCNVFSGKCNRFLYSLDEIDNFLNNVLFFDKCYNQ